MKNASNILAGLIAALAMMVAVPAQAQRKVEAPDGPWTHKATDTQFPENLGDYKRGSITEFSDDGKDAGVGYSANFVEGTLILTIYVYPYVQNYSCEEIFADALRSIEKYKGAEKNFAAYTLPPAGKGEETALLASYLIPEGGMREDMPAVVSDAYLYCPPGNKWLVKYRATWTGLDDDFPDIGGVIKQIAWPKELAGGE